MNRLPLRKRHLSLPLVILMIALLYASATSASTSAGIEGVWSFNGGAVDIVGQPNGMLIGVVTAPTKFSQCVHPVEEQMWTEIRPQGDGSYTGLHRWYYASAACVPNPTYGPTAWRVLKKSNGESFLRVCFSEPDSNSQPTIAPDGSSANWTYGCVDSASIAALPKVSAKEGTGTPTSGQISFGQVVVLPNAKQCIRSRSLKIKLHPPKYDPLKQVVVRVNGKKVADVRGSKKLKKSIVLKHLPGGSYTVKVLAITVLNQRLSGSRRYTACGKGSGKIKLHHPHKPKK